MILDATFLVDLVRGDPGARAFLQEAERGSSPLLVPAPAVARVFEAIERARHPPRDAERVRAVLANAPGAPFGVAEAVRAGRILGAAAREGVALDPFDAMVAAIAIERDVVLVTRDVREFGRIEGLRLRAY